MKLLLRRTRVL